MIYVDTSVMVKLYVREEHSQEVSGWLQNNDEAIPLTPFDDRQSQLALAAGLRIETCIGSRAIGQKAPKR